MAQEASKSSRDAPVLSAIAQACNYLTPNPGCDAKFFPSCSSSFTSDSKIWEYMTKSKVSTLLEECELGLDKKAMDDLAETICYIPSSADDVDFISYRKVFTVLILLRLHDKILQFVKEQFHDDLLPLCNEESLNDPAYKYHACFQNWSLIDMRSFVRCAKEVSAPFVKKVEPGKRCNCCKFPKEGAGNSTIIGPQKRKIFADRIWRDFETHNLDGIRQSPGFKEPCISVTGKTLFSVSATQYAH